MSDVLKRNVATLTWNGHKPTNWNTCTSQWRCQNPDGCRFSAHAISKGRQRKLHSGSHPIRPHAIVRLHGLRFSGKCLILFESPNHVCFLMCIPKSQESGRAMLRPYAYDVDRNSDNPDHDGSSQ